MDFGPIVAEHRIWWDEHRAGEASDLPALGLFKALRNFVHPLLDSRYNPRPGVDWHGEAEEALGDAFMYLCSVGHAAALGLRAPRGKLLYLTAEEAAAGMAEAFAALSNMQTQHNLDWTVAAILAACKVCAVDSEVACRRALCKLLSVS